MITTMYKLVHFGELGTLFRWTEPPSKEAIRQVLNTAEGQVKRVVEADLVRVVKEVVSTYTLEEWFYKYHKEIQND